MKLLATLKAEHYETAHHAYAALVELSWPGGEILRELRFPAPYFRDRTAFGAPLCGGVCRLGERLLVALFNCVVEIDHPSFRITNVVSSPWMSDLHGITTDGRRVWVAATGTQAVLELDGKTLETVGRWGPDAPLLWQPRPGSAPRPVPPRWRRWPLLRRIFPPTDSRWDGAPPLPSGEHRYHHKSQTGLHRHHLNDVRWLDGHLLVMTKGWDDANSSAIIQLDPEQPESARFLVPPGGVRGVHDGELVEGRLVVTESAANGVAWRTPAGQLERRPLEPAGYFVRGLCYTGDGFLVGFTRPRNTTLPGLIVEYDPTFTRERHRVALHGVYPETVGTAIHALLPVPG